VFCFSNNYSATSKEEDVGQGGAPLEPPSGHWWKLFEMFDGKKRAK
jgi:hypothetical protein